MYVSVARDYIIYYHSLRYLIWKWDFYSISNYVFKPLKDSQFSNFVFYIIKLYIMHIHLKTTCILVAAERVC